MSYRTGERVMYPEVPPDPGRPLSAEEFFRLPDDGWRTEPRSISRRTRPATATTGSETREGFVVPDPGPELADQCVAVHFGAPGGVIPTTATT